MGTYILIIFFPNLILFRTTLTHLLTPVFIKRILPYETSSPLISVQSPFDKLIYWVGSGVYLNLTTTRPTTQWCNIETSKTNLMFSDR